MPTNTPPAEKRDHHALSTLFERYETLCRYCDDFFSAVLNEFPSRMQCAKGCASCCLLETVAPLEAHIIASYLQQQPDRIATEAAASSTGESCVFLEHDTCRIYPVRPIICRTHGLPMAYPDRRDYDVCPLNFTDIDLASLDRRYILDAEMIATNFMRLNLAFCLLTQTAEAAEERIALADLLRAGA